MHVVNTHIHADVDVHTYTDMMFVLQSSQWSSHVVKRTSLELLHLPTASTATTIKKMTYPTLKQLTAHTKIYVKYNMHVSTVCFFIESSTLPGHKNVVRPKAVITFNIFTHMNRKQDQSQFDTKTEQKVLMNKK